MLSNPTNLQQRQRQHRRQQSTPTAFEATKVPSLPTVQRHGSHRRGMSLDQRQQRHSPQDNNTVGNTNQGFNDNEQQILRETQQQRLARPGQYSTQYPQTNDDNYRLVAPLVTSHSHHFDDATVLLKYGILQQDVLSQYSTYSGNNNNTTIQANYNDFVQGHMDNGSFSNSGSALSSPFDITEFTSLSYADPSNQEDWGATIRPSGRNSGGRRVSGGIADRVAQFEGMTAEKTASRPFTPSNPNSSNCLPPTPDITPFNRGMKVEGAPNRYSDKYDASMETIKPSRNRSPKRVQTIFQEMRDHAELSHPPSPPSSTPLASPARFDSAPMPSAKSTSSFMNMQNLKLDFGSNDGLGLDFNRDAYESPDWSPTHSSMTPEMSQQSSPDVSHASLLLRAFENRPVLDSPSGQYYLPISPDMDLNEQESPAHESHRRSESVDSMNLEEVITETGITLDDIAQWIAEPDSSHQKWSCLYEDCGKRFGRKENIKSHVQTHLGDRQYQCPHCRKCFVRQHDLKRHAKIHSGVKPYPCACGNSFARHDALTRHRQRGMCVGAFEGAVKKVAKRGRPRKERPDNEERLEKSSKTRSKNRNKAMSSASSVSGYSDDSGDRSPVADDDILDDKPFGDFMNDFQQSGPQTGMDNFYSQTPSPLPTDCVSPQAIQSAPSPKAASNSAFSPHSHYSHASPSRSQHSHRGSVVSIVDLYPMDIPLPTSPAKSTVSQYNTPPELCLSSSPPPSRHSQFFDPEISDEDEMNLNKLAQLQMDQDHEDDIFLEAFGSNTEMGGMNGVINRLDQDMIRDGKFDDAFANVIDGDDAFQYSELYFGSP